MTKIREVSYGYVNLLDLSPVELDPLAWEGLVGWFGCLGRLPSYKGSLT